MSLDRIRGAIPANGRLTKSRYQPAEPTCAYRGERASPDDTRELARDSAVRRAHSTDVRRTRHACAHFLLCRTRHGKLEVGRGCGWRGAVNAAVGALDHRPGVAPAMPRGLRSSCRLWLRLGCPWRNEDAGSTCGDGRAVDGGWAVQPEVVRLVRGTSSRALPVTVGSSCTAQTRQPRPGCGPRAGAGLVDFPLLTRVHALRSLEALVALAVPARGRQSSVDRPQAVRPRIDELHEKSFLFNHPPNVKKC